MPGWCWTLKFSFLNLWFLNNRVLGDSWSDVVIIVVVDVGGGGGGVVVDVDVVVVTGAAVVVAVVVVVDSRNRRRVSLVSGKLKMSKLI